jgi:hypothetical protein
VGNFSEGASLQGRKLKLSFGCAELAVLPNQKKVILNTARFRRPFLVHFLDEQKMNKEPSVFIAPV